MRRVKELACFRHQDEHFHLCAISRRFVSVHHVTEHSGCPRRMPAGLFHGNQLLPTGLQIRPSYQCSRLICQCSRGFQVRQITAHVCRNQNVCRNHRQHDCGDDHRKRSGLVFSAESCRRTAFSNQSRTHVAILSSRRESRAALSVRDPLPHVGRRFLKVNGSLRNQSLGKMKSIRSRQNPVLLS
jgi:hypothetical protein